MITRKILIELKETIFLYLFCYGIFDLKIMKQVNILFNNLAGLINETI